MNVKTTFFAFAFDALCAVGNKRTDELENYGNFALLDSSDDKMDTPNALYDSFYNAIGAKGIHKMISFTILEIKSCTICFRR